MAESSFPLSFVFLLLWIHTFYSQIGWLILKVLNESSRHIRKLALFLLTISICTCFVLFFLHANVKNHVPTWALGFSINLKNAFPHATLTFIQLFFFFRFHIFQLKLVNHLDFICMLRVRESSSFIIRFPK